MSESWAPDPAKHAYTWTFTKRGLLIKYFLWLYETDQKGMTFCRFFWGMVASPIAIPIRLFKGTLRLIAAALELGATGLGVGLDWFFELSPVVTVGTKLTEWNDNLSKAKKLRAKQRELAKDVALEAHYQRQNEESLARWLNFRYYGGIEQGPRPVTPSLQSKIAERLGMRVDKMVAWAQEHPKVVAAVSKTVTRGIFYPLAFLIPASAVGFVGYEIDRHPRGSIGPIHYAWSDVISGTSIAIHHISGAIWDSIRVSGPDILKLAIFSIGTIIVCGVFIWAMVKIDELTMTKVEASPIRDKSGWWLKNTSVVGDLREAPESTFYLKARNSLDRRFTSLERTLTPMFKVAGKGLGLTGKTLGKAAKKTGGVVAAVAEAGKNVAVDGVVGTGRAVRTTGGFFALAHHSIKYRTCPRIEIVDK